MSAIISDYQWDEKSICNPQERDDTTNAGKSKLCCNIIYWMTAISNESSAFLHNKWANSLSDALHLHSVLDVSMWSVWIVNSIHNSTRILTKQEEIKTRCTFNWWVWLAFYMYISDLSSYSTINVAVITCASVVEDRHLWTILQIAQWNTYVYKRVSKWNTWGKRRKELGCKIQRWLLALDIEKWIYTIAE
jgi:hypothetical protein